MLAGIETIILQLIRRVGRAGGSTFSANSLATVERETWRQIRKELESKGVPSALIREKKQIIVSLIQRAVVSEASTAGSLPDLDEENEASRIAREKVLKFLADLESDAGLSEFSEDGYYSDDGDDEMSIESFSTVQQRSGSRPHANDHSPIAVSRHNLQDISVPSVELIEPKNHHGSADELVRAVEVGDISKVRNIISTGADVNCISNGWSALHMAADHGDGELVLLLLDHGADIEAQAKISGFTATTLHVAARGGFVAVIRILLEKGAEINQTTKKGWAALHFASRLPSAEAAQLLLDHGADVTRACKKGWTALHFASTLSDGEIAGILLDHGAEIDVQTTDHGETPLMKAALCGREDVVRLLLERGADITKADKTSCTPLHFAAQSGNTEAIRLLLNRGADTETVEMDFLTPLHIATAAGFVPAIRVLLDYGAQIDSQSSDGHSPLILAAAWGDEEVVPLLLNHDVDTEKMDNGSWTALHHACQYGHAEVVQILLEHGANIEARTGTSRDTPLIKASRHGNETVVRLLLDHGADTAATNKKRRTALHYAKGFHNEDISQLLSDNGTDTTAEVNSRIISSDLYLGQLTIAEPQFEPFRLESFPWVLNGGEQVRGVVGC